MSRQDGKEKNWGSRSGRIKGKALDSSIEALLATHSLSTELLEKIAACDANVSKAAAHLLKKRNSYQNENFPTKVFSTKLGDLYNGDCMALMSQIDDNSIDCIFADPPFNLSKKYANGNDDALSDLDYLEWSYAWLERSVTKLKPGGSLFVYNIPKWANYYASFLSNYLCFKNWIAVDITMSMPIPGRLYPSHYALLYFVKGVKPSVFNPPRVPIKTCIRCGQEQNDYGGYKMKMNPKGVNIRDVWTDIPPVRHSKYKNRDANELNIKLLDRVLDISTGIGDLVFDPFGGSGTTYIVAELKRRRWIGAELGDCSPIVRRFSSIQDDMANLEKHRKDINTLFTDKALQLRANSGLPLDNYRITDEQIKRAVGEIQQSIF